MMAEAWGNKPAKRAKAGTINFMMAESQPLSTPELSSLEGGSFVVHLDSSSRVYKET